MVDHHLVVSLRTVSHRHWDNSYLVETPMEKIVFCSSQGLILLTQVLRGHHFLLKQLYEVFDRGFGQASLLGPKITVSLEIRQSLTDNLINDVHKRMHGSPIRIIRADRVRISDNLSGLSDFASPTSNLQGLT